MSIRAGILFFIVLGLAACNGGDDNDVNYPAAQKAFHALNSACDNKYEQGINEIQKSEAFNQCNAQRMAFSKTNSISGWVGHIDTISTSQGATLTEVDISAEIDGFKIIYGTTNNQLSEDLSETKSMILPDSPLFNKLANMKEGDIVVFDAEFLPDPEPSHGIWESSVTEAGSMSRPSFIVRFSDIRLYSASSGDTSNVLTKKPSQMEAGSTSASTEKEDSQSAVSSTSASQSGVAANTDIASTQASNKQVFAEANNAAITISRDAVAAFSADCDAQGIDRPAVCGDAAPPSALAKQKSAAAVAKYADDMAALKAAENSSLTLHEPEVAAEYAAIEKEAEAKNSSSDDQETDAAGDAAVKKLTGSLPDAEDNKQESSTERAPTKPVPAHDEFVAWCMKTEANEQGGQFGSVVDRGIARATCECRYENLPNKMVMTKEEYINSGVKCEAKKNQDLDAFLQTYHRSATQGAAAGQAVDNDAQQAPPAQMEPAEGGALSSDNGQSATGQMSVNGSSEPAANVQQAPTPDDEYHRRTSNECPRGLFGKACRHNVREQVCANIQPGSPGASVCQR